MIWTSLIQEPLQDQTTKHASSFLDSLVARDVFLSKDNNKDKVDAQPDNPNMKVTLESGRHQ